MRKLSRGLALLLSLVMLLGMLPTGILAAEGSTAALLDGITVDGKPLEGFANAKKRRF